MDIPALSMAMAQNNLATNVGVAMLKNSMDTAEVAGEGLKAIMEQSVTPGIGSVIDISM